MKMSTPRAAEKVDWLLTQAEDFQRRWIDDTNFWMTKALDAQAQMRRYQSRLLLSYVVIFLLVTTLFFLASISGG